MLRYFSGAVPGKKRHSESQQSCSDRKEAKRLYEKNRKREFQVSWQVERDWLLFDQEKQLMSCSYCKEFNTEKSAFVKGCDNFRLESVKQHESCRAHVDAVTKHHAKINPVAQSKAAQCLVNLKKAEYDRLVLKFRNAHAVAKTNLSFRTYTTLCKLDDIKGLDVGSSYVHDKSAAEFISNISKVTTADIKERLEQCNFCSFTCDGTTDFTGEDLENIYLRTCSKGTTKDSFLHIGSAKSASSLDIYNYITSVFEEMEISTVMSTKLVGFCADGASNMQGNGIHL